jgi:hypothetical protein
MRGTYTSAWDSGGNRCPRSRFPRRPLFRGTESLRKATVEQADGGLSGRLGAGSSPVLFAQPALLGASVALRYSCAHCFHDDSPTEDSHASAGELCAKPDFRGREREQLSARLRRPVWHNPRCARRTRIRVRHGERAGRISSARYESEKDEVLTGGRCGQPERRCGGAGEKGESSAAGRARHCRLVQP